MHIVITKPRCLRRAAQISKYSDTSATSAPAHCPTTINLQTWTGQRHNKIFRIAAHFLSTRSQYTMCITHVKSIGTSQSSQIAQSWKKETRNHCFFSKKRHWSLFGREINVSTLQCLSTGHFKPLRRMLRPLSILACWACISFASARLAAKARLLRPAASRAPSPSSWSRRSLA